MLGGVLTALVEELGEGTFLLEVDFVWDWVFGEEKDEVEELGGVSERRWRCVEEEEKGEEEALLAFSKVGGGGGVRAPEGRHAGLEEGEAEKRGDAIADAIPLPPLRVPAPLLVLLPALFPKYTFSSLSCGSVSSVDGEVLVYLQLAKATTHLYTLV